MSVNSAVLDRPELVDEAASLFGSQCVVVSIDFRAHPDGRREVFASAGAKATGRNPVEWAQEVAERGAGEILLTSIERDGSMTGYDLELIRRVTDAVSIPVIASGGAGSYEHMREAVCDANASAIAAASIFHFTEQTPLEAKKYLADHGVAVRI